MRVLIMSDMEGVSGIVVWDQVNGGAPLYEECRRLYTEEINAAIRGAKAAGATEIVAVDCHSSDVRAAKYPPAVAPKLGDPVFAIGNPQTLAWSFSPGSISFTDILVPCRSTAIDSLHPHRANLLAQ